MEAAMVYLPVGGVLHPAGSFASQLYNLREGQNLAGLRGKSQISILAPSIPSKSYGAIQTFRGTVSTWGDARDSFSREILYYRSSSSGTNLTCRLRASSTIGFNLRTSVDHARAIMQESEQAGQMAGLAGDAEWDDEQVESGGDIDEGYIIQESLNLFEWPSICAQVAQFTSTPMGTSIARVASLSIGSTQEQSEELLDQTAAAFELRKALDFSDIDNLQEIVGDALSGNICQIKDLSSIRSTLLGVQRIYDQLCGPSSDSLNSNCSALQGLISNRDLCSDLVQDIEHCIDSTVETVLDRASSALAGARLSRKENMRALESLLKETALWVVQQGGMDSVVVTRRRARSCIAVRSSHKNLLPGGLTLDVSNTGTTSFMEPEPALKLNNEEMRLAGVEKAEELAVLERLTRELVDRAELIMDLMGRITMIDLACARASHARWLGSVRPYFHEQSITQEALQGGLMADIEEIRHPLLLGRVLPNLPVTQRFGVAQASIGSRLSSTGLNGVENVGAGLSVKGPVPVNIKVKAKVSVVTITGPNTGGKTATLKTLGVVALMAKAGLFIPAVGQPKLPWFDVVLADVGDEQSLERSLSTFSGHIRRLRSILEICTPRSLVLLDEIGGGTDPTEGAALATAVLRHLSSKVKLCIATTHSAELKVLKDQDARFENASVEFDIKTLRPTYRVLWGVAGQSNALDIAETLEFDMAVLARARELLVKMKPSQLGVRTMELLVPLVKQRDDQLERAKRALNTLTEAQGLYSEVSAAATNLPKRAGASKRMLAQAVEEDIAKAKLEIDEVIEKFHQALDQDNPPTIREVQAEIASIVEKYSVEEGQSTALAFLPPAVRTPQRNLDRTPVADRLTVGEAVIVRKLGKTPVTLVDIPENSEYVTVQLGALKMQVKMNEVIKIRNGGPASASKSNDKVSYKVNTNRQTKGQVKAEGTASPETYEVAIQTSKNTLDLRGMRVEDAMRELNMTLSSKSPRSVIFLVHGVGTGAVKEAALQVLRKHPYVAKFEAESITNAGCTIVYIK